MPRICAAASVLLQKIERDPGLLSRQTKMRSTLAQRVAAGTAFGPRDIPVVVHVLYKDSADNISDQQIQSQIDVLNEDFNNRNADLTKVPEPFKPMVGNPDISFHLVEGGITRTRVEVDEFPTDDSMKSSATGGVDGWDPRIYMNVWVCRLKDRVLGYAQFPDTGSPETDGVVVIPSAFGRGSSNPDFNLGRTATHEVGHYLGLHHIWGPTSVFHNCSDDDDVADTPVQYGPNYEKPTFPSVSCSNEPEGDMFMNFMDYVDDDSMMMFSAGQVARMHAVLAISRPDLGVSSSGRGLSNAREDLVQATA